MPDHALELSFDPGSEAAIEEQWQALREAGIPSQADHKAMRNAPHLTLVAAAGIDPALVPWAADLVRPLLPAPIPLVGLLLLGTGPRVTIAHLAEPDARLAELTTLLRSRTPHVRHATWTPHVTLARRVPRALVPRALEVLGALPAVRQVTADRLRWWDPTLDLIEDVVSV